MQAPEFAKRIIGSFERKYPGIKVSLVRNARCSLIAMMDQERRSRVADADVAIHTTLAWFRSADERGELLPVSGPASATWPQQYRRGGTIMPSLEPFVIAYNTNRVAPIPVDYNDVIQEEFTGLIGTTEASVGAAGIAFYSWLGEQYDPRFLRKLRAQNPRLYNGGQPATQALGSGVIGGNIYAVPSQTMAMKAQGAPVDFVIRSRVSA